MDSGAVVLSAGLTLGLLGWWSRIPGGGLLGGMTGAALAVMLGDLPQLGGNVSFVAQVVVGAAVGSTLTWATVARLRSVALGAAIVLGVNLTLAMVAAEIFARTTSVDLATALLSTMPGGAAAMAASAFALGADAALIVAIHSVRQVFVTAVLPLAISLVGGRYGRKPKDPS